MTFHLLLKITFELLSCLLTGPTNASLVSLFGEWHVYGPMHRETAKYGITDMTSVTVATACNLISRKNVFY